MGRHELSRWLIRSGGLVLLLGLALLLVKLMVMVAYYYAGATVVIGAIALLAGVLLGRR